MIGDKQKAKAALDQRERAHQLLMDSLRFVKANCSDAELTQNPKTDTEEIRGKLGQKSGKGVFCIHLLPSQSPVRDFALREVAERVGTVIVDFHGFLFAVPCCF